MPRRKRPLAEAPPPESEQITSPELDPIRQQPAPQEPNGHESESFAARVRPDAPRQRDPNEPANIFASKDLRIDRDGHMYQMRAERDLTGDEKDFASRHGLVPVDDEERVFNASQRDIIKAKGDINQVAHRIGKHPDTARGR